MKTVIISAYFQFKSKKPHKDYVFYLQRFFRSIRTKTFFFTTPTLIEEIKGWNFNNENIEFIPMEIEEWKAWKLGREFWQRQKERDPEPYHTPELGAIWYEKKMFVERVMQFFEADLYVWCDAGCVRDDIAENSLQNFGKRNIHFNDNCIHFQQINHSEKKDFYRFPYSKIAGAIIAGNKKAWQDYIQLYNVILEKYDNARVTCMSDQYISLSCYDMNPSLCKLHLYNPSSKIDKWFFFLEIL